MRTEALMIQTLCVPCACRCRYCLLSWDGRPVGVPWERSCRLAERLIPEARQARPGLNVSFSFGYSMEHPALREALRFLRRIGSPQAGFLQCDGMRQRDEAECAALASLLREEGVRAVNFTFYGLPAYHDGFAGRAGDFALLLRMLEAAANAGLDPSAGIPLNDENIDQADELIRILLQAGCGRLSLFIPHEEGRGAFLAPHRLREGDLDRLFPENRPLINRDLYRAEAAWLREPPPKAERRALLLSLTPNVIDRYEVSSAEDLIQELERLDDVYENAFPPFEELAKLYGDPDGDRLYRFRDLHRRYQRLFAQEHRLHLYDVTDERQSGSRRY